MCPDSDPLYLESEPIPPNRDPDNAVILSAASLGSDIARPHLVEFFLYFPGQDVAEVAAARIRNDGFHAEASLHCDDRDWTVLAAKVMMLNLATIQDIRIKFTALAESLGGEYDGWETGIVQ